MKDEKDVKVEEKHVKPDAAPAEHKAAKVEKEQHLTPEQKAHIHHKPHTNVIN